MELGGTGETFLLQHSKVTSFEGFLRLSACLSSLDQTKVNTESGTFHRFRLDPIVLKQLNLRSLIIPKSLFVTLVTHLEGN